MRWLGHSLETSDYLPECSTQDERSKLTKSQGWPGQGIEPACTAPDCQFASYQYFHISQLGPKKCSGLMVSDFERYSANSATMAQLLSFYNFYLLFLCLYHMFRFPPIADVNFHSTFLILLIISLCTDVTYQPMYTFSKTQFNIYFIYLF